MRWVLLEIYDSIQLSAEPEIPKSNWRQSSLVRHCMSTVEKYSVQASISHARPPCEASENTQGQNNSSEKKLDRLFVKNSYIIC